MKDLSSPDLVSLPSTKRRLASETDSDPGSITAEDQNELDEVSFWQLLKLNATEWPYMAGICLISLRFDLKFQIIALKIRILILKLSKQPSKWSATGEL